MKAIKIESCAQCHNVYDSIVKRGACCKITQGKIVSLLTIDKDCPLENYPDIEAIKELCNQPYDSYRELAADILDLIN